MRRAPPVQVISPARTASRMRVYSSAGIFVRRHLVVISQPFSHVAAFSTAGDPSKSLSQWNDAQDRIRLGGLRRTRRTVRHERLSTTANPQFAAWLARCRWTVVQANNC